VKQPRINQTANKKNDGLNINFEIQKFILEGIIKFLQIYITKTLAIRIICGIMIALEIHNANIRELLGICNQSIRKYKKMIASKNLDEFFTVKGGGRKCSLVANEQAIRDMIDTHNFHSRQQIADAIEERLGFKPSLPAIFRFLKKQGVKLLKYGSIPAKADPKKQRTFYENTLLPLIERAKSGAITLLFMDGSHFVMGGMCLGYVYSAARRFAKAFSGRQRYNVLGALDMVTKKLTKITNHTYISAQQVCELLHKIADEYKGNDVCVVLDNARYQKCKLVQECANKLGITLEYMPPYSPNLNLIERYWKHVKTKLRIKYYDNYTNFYETIDSICANTEGNKALDRLISGKVQLFDDFVAINESTYSRKKPGKMAA
jgi:transposase